MAGDQTDRRDGFSSSVAVKAPVRLASTGALVYPFTGLGNIDGVTPVAGDRILVKDQGDQTQNGIWVADTANWSRAADADGNSDMVNGTLILITSGTANASLFVKCTSSNPVTIGSSAITFSTAAISLAGISSYMQTVLPAANAAAARALLGVILDNLQNRGADIASAATINLETATGDIVDITGSVNITAITLGDGHMRWTRFTGAPTLSFGASLITPAGVDYVAAVGDIVAWRGYSGGVVRAVTGLRANGSPFGSGGVVASAYAGSGTPLAGMINGTIVTSRSGSAETIAIKTFAGIDPSAADPVIFVFRDATAGTGDYSFMLVTAALSVTISSGSTLGAANTVPFRIWLVAFNDAGTVRLGIVNARSGTSIMSLRADDIKSSTAEGGAGAADSAQVIYTGTAVASKAMAMLGYLEYTLATAGTWVTAPSKTQLFGMGVPLPGHVVQEVYTQSGAVVNGTTTVPFDDTIPQNTEGDQFMSQAITPTSAVNVLDVQHIGSYTNSSGVDIMISLFQDAIASALAAIIVINGTAGGVENSSLRHRMLAGTTSATTLKVRAGGAGAGTTTFNGSAGSRLMGGVIASSIGIKEIMA